MNLKKHNDKYKKAVSKDNKLYDSIFTKYLKRNIYIESQVAAQD